MVEVITVLRRQAKTFSEKARLNLRSQNLRIWQPYQKLQLTTPLTEHIETNLITEKT